LKTIFGQVFMQKVGLGKASYHFTTEEGCYISYESAPPNWLLSDGSRLPAKKFFSETSWDPETRTFRGRVDWDPPFNGVTRWDYEMVFSEDLSKIVDGSVIESKEERVANKRSFGEDLLYRRWTQAAAHAAASAAVAEIFRASAWRAALRAAGADMLADFPRGPGADEKLKGLLNTHFKRRAEEMERARSDISGL